MEQIDGSKPIKAPEVVVSYCSHFIVSGRLSVHINNDLFFFLKFKLRELGFRDYYTLYLL